MPHVLNFAVVLDLIDADLRLVTSLPNNERVCILSFPFSEGVLVKLTNLLHVLLELDQVKHILVSNYHEEGANDDDNRADNALDLPSMRHEIGTHADLIERDNNQCRVRHVVNQLA